jgi:uncharacterized metal-binding protein YceD (DUF177 family)
MSVNEYVTKFTQLSHYAPHEVDTDEKMQDYLLNGLNDGLAFDLEALVVENCIGVMERKSKLVR